MNQIVKPIATAEGGERADELNLEAVEHAKAQLAASQLRLQETLKDFKLMIIWSVTLVADVADANISLAEHDEKGKGSGLAGNYDLIAMATYGRSGLEH